MRRSGSRRRRWLRALVLAALVVTLGVSAFALHLDLRVRAEFEGRRFALPARVYARPLELFPGLRLGEDALLAELARLGYVGGLRAEEPGHYARAGATVTLVARAFTFWDGRQPARPLQVSFDEGRVRALVDFHGNAVKLARLDPV